MDKKEKSIIKVILVVIILTITIIIILMNLINNEIENIEDDNIPQDTIANNEIIDKLNTYFMFDLEKVINEWFINLENNNAEKILNVLGNNYKKENHIDMNNVLEKLKNQYSEFLIQEVYSSENERNGEFYIYGLGKNIKEESLDDTYFIVNVDYENYTYEIYPTDLDTYLKAKNGVKDTVKYKNINKNDDNSITITEKNTEELIQKYLYDYKNKINFDLEKAYECLDDTIKNQKYNSIKLYKAHIENNPKIKEITGIKTYSKQIKDEFIEYTVIDNNGISYIINAEGLMNYKIIID